jgi:hypothetical protein
MRYGIGPRVCSNAMAGSSIAFKLTAVALANKLARIVFAILRSGGVYDDRPVTA